MPPRYAYWTILIDEQPTAFRASSQDDLMPTFKRLKEKNATAKMMWWQNGKLWNSRLDAQEAMRARGEMGRAKDFRQRGDARPSGGFRNHDRDQRPERNESGKLDWKPKGDFPSGPDGPVRRTPDRESRTHSSSQALKPSGRPRAQRDTSLEWKPKGEGLAPRDHLLRRNVRESAKPAWKPKGDRKPEWKPKGAGFGNATKKPWATTAPRSSSKPARERSETGKLEWRPKGSSTPGTSRSHAPSPKPHAPKRQWVPKEEYKKAQGIEVPRDKKWRPGGEHRDPRQKYKDAKKAKWGRFKQNIRQKWEAKQTGGKKRRGEE